MLTTDQTVLLFAECNQRKSFRLNWRFKNHQEGSLTRTVHFLFVRIGRQAPSSRQPQRMFEIMTYALTFVSGYDPAYLRITEALVLADIEAGYTPLVIDT